MSTHKICLYKEVDKKYTGCNLKTTKLLDCALIGVCVVIRSNTVSGAMHTMWISIRGVSCRGLWLHKGAKRICKTV